MKRIILTFLGLIFALNLSFAGEGMWIPLLLKANESEMQRLGMRITAEDIYSINKSSLKDAILQFGRGCTAEIISDQGLIITNHHCGYGQIQQHSTIDHDYLTDGFWAMSKGEELPNPGLTVTLLIRMEDVTKQVLEGVSAGISDAQREMRVQANIDKLTKSATEGNRYNAFIRPFYYGSEYYMFVTQVFRDVRLVGAPPSSIGKFGGDTDNWVWPRHTGDFSFFRIYVDKNNEPADYSPDNVPYKPKNHLKVSLKGVEEGDFTFVFGYPGRTQEYLPSQAIQMITEKENPAAIRLRQKRLDIFNFHQAQDPAVRIQYAAKNAGVSNYWKKMIGESRGIARLDAVNKKQVLEKDFQQWANATPARRAKYGNLIPAFGDLYGTLTPLSLEETYLVEAGTATEAIRFANNFRPLVNRSNEKGVTNESLQAVVLPLKQYTENYFKDYYQLIDRKVFSAVMSDWYANRESAPWTAFMLEEAKKYSYDFDKWAEDLFDKSVFTRAERLNSLLTNYKAADVSKIEKDPLYKLSQEIYTYYNGSVRPRIQRATNVSDSLQRVYMAGLREFQPNRRFYPDANSTLRVTYGNVDGFKPQNAVTYRYYTTIDGIMEKEDPNIYDYQVDAGLKRLWKDKDYGPYAHKDGTLRVAFIASNHTTGGNSGSPVLNADGHLVGVNFDRSWEGTMSDLMYDPDYSRNISIDIRYALFITDKLAGAKHLVDEMTLVK